MGCDIHMVVEKKIGERWIGVHAFQRFYTREKRASAIPLACDRNYERFAALAGVRGDGPEARGLPDDLSDLAQLDGGYYLGDHSFSWLPLRDAANIFAATERGIMSVWAKDYPCEFFFSVTDYRETDLDSYRLVFGFDS